MTRKGKKRKKHTQTIRQTGDRKTKTEFVLATANKENSCPFLESFKNVVCIVNVCLYELNRERLLE